MPRTVVACALVVAIAVGVWGSMPGPAAGQASRGYLGLPADLAVRDLPRPRERPPRPRAMPAPLVELAAAPVGMGVRDQATLPGPAGWAAPRWLHWLLATVVAGLVGAIALVWTLEAYGQRRGQALRRTPSLAHPGRDSSS